MIIDPMVCRFYPYREDEDPDLLPPSQPSPQLPGCSQEFQCLGVVIWHQDSFGEVLVHENFKGSDNVHYVYTPETSMEYSDCYDPLDVASIVDIKWTSTDCVPDYFIYRYNNLTRTAKKPPAQSQHFIRYITRMEVKQCSVIENLQVVIMAYHSKSAPGVAIARKENYDEVFFHTSCQHRTKQATYNAAIKKQNSFYHSFFFSPPCKKDKLFQRYLVVLPFASEFYYGTFHRIKFLAISDDDERSEQSSELCYNGPAVITKEIPKVAFEARFITNNQVAYCPLSSLPLKYLSSVRVSMMVYVKAIATFKSSLYFWHGTEVTTISSKTKEAQELRTFWLENKKKKIVFTGRGYRETAAKPVEPPTDTKLPKDLKKETQSKEHFKTSYFLMSTFNVCGSVYAKEFKEKQREKRMQKKSSWKLKMEKQREIFEQTTSKATYLLPWCNSDSKREEIYADRQALHASFRGTVPLPCLGKNSNLSKTRSRECVDLLKDNKEEYMLRVQELCKEIAPQNGIARSKRFKKTCVIPDTRWAPCERIEAGAYDNFQWLMMSSFAPLPANHADTSVKEGDEGNSASVAPSSDGFWYRRKAPREAPAYVVAQLCTTRDVHADCTVDMYATETVVLFDDVV